MGLLDAVVNMEAERDKLQKAPNYLINPSKQHVYTINEAHVEAIQVALPQHTVVYIGNEHGFKLSGIPIGGEQYIRHELQKNIDNTKKVIKAISTLDSKQEKLILLLQCIPGRIQHLLAAVPPSISRDYARQHD